MKNVIYVIVGIFVVVIMIIASSIGMENMEKDCAAKHGTFMKAADPMLSMCIIPPK